MAAEGDVCQLSSTIPMGYVNRKSTCKCNKCNRLVSVMKRKRALCLIQVEDAEEETMVSGWGEAEDMKEDLLKDWGEVLDKWDGKQKDKGRPKQLSKLCRKVSVATWENMSQCYMYNILVSVNNWQQCGYVAAAK